MLKILHKGIQYSAPLIHTSLTGDVETDSKIAYIQSLVGGRLATLSANGVDLADAAEGDICVGFIINDAAGYFYENKPALASGLVPLSIGNQIVVTDQIVTAEVFAIGDLLYIGSGADKGLVTKTIPASGNKKPIGIAGSVASASSPELQIIVLS